MKKTKVLTADSKPLRQRSVDLPIMPAMCATCPFRDGSPYEFLRQELSMHALSANSRVCHSTGSGNAINHRTGKPPMLCRGARNLQLKYFASTGFLEAATDEAWTKMCKQMGLL